MAPLGSVVDCTRALWSVARAMLRLLLLLLLCAVGSPTFAQTATDAGPARSAPSGKAEPVPAAPVPPQITKEQAEQALAVLQDEKKRSQLISVLSTIAAGAAQTGNGATRPAAAPPPAAHKLPIPLAPHSLGAQVLVGATRALGQAEAEAKDALSAVRSIPSVVDWVRQLATDPSYRALLFEAAWRVVVVLGCSLLVEWAARLPLQRPINGLVALVPENNTHEASEPGHEASHEGLADDHTPVADEAEVEVAVEPRRRRPSAFNLLRHLPLVLARLVLQLIPVGLFAVVGHLLTGTMVGGSTLDQLVLLAIIDAYVLYRVVMCVAQMMFAPECAPLRLLNVRDSTAAYVVRWLRRLTIATVFFYAAAEVGVLLGLSDVGRDAVIKTGGFVDHVFLGIIVIQQRRPIARRLRPRARHGKRGVLSALAARLASVWHWIALFYLVASWFVWAVELPNGYVRLLHFCIVTTAVLLVLRLVHIIVLGSLDRALHQPAVFERYPELESRARVYHPVLRSILSTLLIVIGFVVLLQVWGLGAAEWFVRTRLGHGVLSALGTILVTVLIAVAGWEGVNAAITRHLARLTREAQMARSARLRTLLPLFRSTLLITILVFAGLTVLSEIGVDIGPLLAGAGIVGIALGFGSQKLVQDLINGIFLLLENAMQVGDWVTVSGLSGTVENLSVRTIRLRAGDGSVHVIPFSSVTTVTNVNRGIGNASVSVTVAYSEDTDRVFDLLKEIASGLKEDEKFKDQMLSDLQLWGVDKVDGSAVTIAGQIVCTDAGRWAVQREFNRRMKKRFQEVGIQIFNPLQTMLVTAPAAVGEAPAPAASIGTAAARESRRA